MITLLTLIFLYFFKIDFLYLQIFNVAFYFYATLLYFNEHENKYEIHTNFNYDYKEPYCFLEPKPKLKKIIDFCLSVSKIVVPLHCLKNHTRVW